MFPIYSNVTPRTKCVIVSSQRYGGSGSSPVILSLSMDLQFPESFLCQIPACLEEVIFLEPVNCIMIISCPCPGHHVTCKLVCFEKSILPKNTKNIYQKGCG